MHKQLIATALLLLALSRLRNLKKPSKVISFVAFGFLAAFSHEAVFAIFMAILLYISLLGAHRKSGEALPIMAVAALVSLIFVGVWYRWRFDVILERGLGSFSPLSNVSLFDRWWWELTNSTTIFLQLYGLAIPLATLGMLKSDVLFPWLFLGLLGSFSPVLFPFHNPWQGFPPSRWMLLLAYPISLLAANALDKARLAMARSPLRLGSLAIILAMIILANAPTWGFIGMTAQPQIFVGPGLIPRTMASSSIPIYDINATIQLLGECNRFDGEVIIVYGDYVGWAKYYAYGKVITFGPLYGRGRSIKQALELALKEANNPSNIYLLWYADGDAYKLKFAKVAESGDLKLYMYCSQGQPG